MQQSTIARIQPLLYEFGQIRDIARRARDLCETGCPRRPRRCVPHGEQRQVAFAAARGKSANTIGTGREQCLNTGKIGRRPGVKCARRSPLVKAQP